MMLKIEFKLSTFAAALMLSAMMPLAAARAADPVAPAKDMAAEKAASAIAEKSEWPCVSAKVLEITPAQIWDGPSLEGVGNWRDDDQIRKLSEYVVLRRIPLEEAEAALKTYADSVPEAERDAKLTLLFAGVLSRINDERKIVMSGIERFHKRQLARAAVIEKEGIALPDAGAPLPVEPVPGSEIDKISEEEDRFNWDVRVFQEKQQNIPIACEIPQFIDERAGAIARAIRANMKS